MNDIFLEEKEILSRIDAFQKKLAKLDVAGVLLSSETNVLYFSGYSSHAPWSTFTRPSFMFIGASGKPILYLQTFVAPEARASTFGCEVMQFDSLLGPTPKELQDIMYQNGLKNGKIGFELGFEQRIGFQVDIFLELKNLCKNETFIDISKTIWEQRIIKSSYEIECIKRACNATSYAHDEIYKYLKQGMSERDIIRKVQSLMLDGGAESPGFEIITSGKGNYGRISKINTNRNLLAGDFLWLDLGARYNGYYSDFCRAGYVGVVPKKFNDLQKVVEEVTANAACIMKPGISVAELAKKCQDELKKNGEDATFDCGRMGHGMGLNSTEPPSVTIYDDTILDEGMIINLEPGIVNCDGVFVIEENYVITKNGFERLSGGNRSIRQIKQ